MKISVIMLTHNREQYVANMIESIVHQTYRDFEFIIIDNGSKDKSGTVAARYAAEDERIKVLHIAEGSIGHGRNIGIAHANGEYITFVDDDDIAYPNLLKFLCDILEKTGSDISICGANENTGDRLLPHCCTNEMKILTPQEAVSCLLERRTIRAGLPLKLFKKTLFADNPIPEDGKYEDIKITYKLLACAKRIVQYGLPQYEIIRHEDNNTSYAGNEKLISALQLDEYLKAISERTRYLTDRYPELYSLARYSEWSYMLSMCEKIADNHLQDCQKQYEYMLNVLKENLNELSESEYIQEFEKDRIIKIFGGRLYA